MKHCLSRNHRLRPRAFTLIEMLVVILIIAILSAIAIPTYLGYRARAQDAAAVELVRNGLTAVQSALAEVGNYARVTEAILEEEDHNIDWVPAAGDIVVVSGTPTIDTSATTARADMEQIGYFVDPPNRIDIASLSASGSWFAIQVDLQNQSETGYVKIKWVDGSVEEGW